jgi:hypothetical protein
MQLPIRLRHALHPRALINATTELLALIIESVVSISL